MNCLICGQKADRHHVATRKSGGGDEDWNLMPLSRRHHVEVHQIGLKKFAEKYHQVQTWLIENGWKINEVKGKWTRY